MAEIGFYHLTRANLAEGLFKLLQKAHENGLRVLVRGQTDACIQHLNEALWTLDPASFLPHGSDQEPHAEHQPILLTTSENNRNQATALMIVEDAPFPPLEGITRIFYLFEDRDTERKDIARERWKSWKADGHDMVYWQQGDNGGWQKKA